MIKSDPATDPLVPGDVDLRGMQFMPLDTDRLVDSDLAAIATGDQFKAAVLLWCKAWKQVPASSLPDNDVILARLSGAGPKWSKVKDVALRGFVKCSDGRLYHPVIADKAMEAWEKRDEFRTGISNKTERQKRWRQRLKAISAELRARGVTPPAGASLETMETLLASTVDGNASTAASTGASTVRRLVDQSETGKTVTVGEGIPPKEYPPVRKKAARRRNRTQEGITFDEWVSQCKAKGEERIPVDDPVRRYAADAGISDDFMRLAWVSFGRKYSGSNDRYLDWRQTFRNAVEGNWLKLWYAVDEGGYKLTTVGESLRRALASKAEKAAVDA